MTCFYPQTAYLRREVNDSGKRSVTFNRNEAFRLDDPLRLPCGKCIGCEERRILDMSLRCVHEKRVRRPGTNWMLTLTYDDANLPDGGSLRKAGIRSFLKEMWEAYPRGEDGRLFRYYVIGEYGSRTARAHYHVLFFDLELSDARHAYDRKGRFPVWESRKLSEIWWFGRIQIDELNENTAKYVCGYVTQKLVAKGHSLDMVDKGTGEVFEREGEFSVASRNPALGKEWFDRFAVSDVYKNKGTVLLQGSSKMYEVAPPKYYDYLLDKADPVLCEKVKKVRKKAAKERQVDDTPERRRVKEQICRAARNRRDERRARNNLMG